MSKMEFLNEWKYLLVPIMIFGTLGIILISIVNHDMDINNEEWYHIMYRGDTCKELLFSKSFEDRKIIKGDIELMVLKHYLKEGNC